MVVSGLGNPVYQRNRHSLAVALGTTKKVGLVTGISKFKQSLIVTLTNMCTKHQCMIFKPV